ncbi:hypothetical protein GCM10023259_011060 [Thermocatellispora tengchongensis]
MPRVRVGPGVTEQDAVAGLGRAQYDGPVGAHGDQDSPFGQCRQKPVRAAVLREHFSESGVPDAHMVNDR